MNSNAKTSWLKKDNDLRLRILHAYGIVRAIEKLK